MGEQQQRQERHWDAAVGEPPSNAPVDCAIVRVHCPAANLGEAGIQKVGANRRRRMDAERKHEKRGHQRAAADTGEAHEQPDKQARQGEDRVDVMEKRHTRGSQPARRRIAE